MFGFIDSHFLLFMLLVGTILSAIWLIICRKQLGMRAWLAPFFAILHTFLEYWCARVFALMEAWDISAWGAVSLFGVVIFMPLFYYIGAKITKRRVAVVFDLFFVCIVLTLFCTRVNCLHGGCCIGKILPFGDGTLRWPAREAEMIFYVLLLAFTIPRLIKEEMHGKAYPIYLTSYGIFRFLNELLREPSSSPTVFHIGHLWSLIAAIVGISILIEMSYKKHSSGRTRTRRKNHD